MNRPWLRRVALACALPAALLLTGCDAITGLVGGVDGTYVLATVNGQSLPAVIDSGTFDGTLIEVRIVSSRLELEEGTYDIEISFDILADGSHFESGTESETGTFEVDGDVITMDPGTEDEQVGRVDGDELRFNIEGDSWVFEKD